MNRARGPANDAAAAAIALGATLASMLAACHRDGPTGVGAGASDGASTAAATTAAPAPAARAAGATKRCAEIACERYATPEAALARVLASDPRVLAIGETHAQAGVNAPSSTKRFTDAFLPVLARRAASDLVVELWVGNAGCTKQVKEVAERQKPVTATQAPTDQNEFVALGDAAKKIGIAPHALVPSCEEYTRILDAGTGDVDAMLTMIARLSGDELEALAKRHVADGKLVVAYGGAMHNDLRPRVGRESWSFGPRLAKVTNDRYVELDLVVPEAIKDTDAWRSLPWYRGYAPEAHAPGETILFFVAPNSYALVFPRSG